MKRLNYGYETHPMLHETKYTSLCFTVGEVLVTALEQEERKQMYNKDTLPSEDSKFIQEEIKREEKEIIDLAEKTIRDLNYCLNMIALVATLVLSVQMPVVYTALNPSAIIPDIERNYTFPTLAGNLAIVNEVALSLSILSCMSSLASITAAFVSFVHLNQVFTDVRLELIHQVDCRDRHSVGQTRDSPGLPVPGPVPSPGLGPAGARNPASTVGQ